MPPRHLCLFLLVMMLLIVSPIVRTLASTAQTQGLTVNLAVNEELQTGSVIGNVINSLHLPNGTRVQLLARESPFGLDERGNVSVRARVDRDARCPRIASTSGSAQSRLAQGGTGTVASSNSGSGSSTAASSSACRETLVAMLYSPRPDIGTQTLTVSITINDINDNAPAFTSFDWPVQLSEGAIPGTSAATIRIPKAFDADDGVNGAVQYRLEGPDATFFNVSASGSDAELALTLQRPLDRERKARLSFTLVATDGGHPRNNASLPVIIEVLDVNEHEPEFEGLPYRAVVPESTPIGSTILRVHAKDRDQMIAGTGVGQGQMDGILDNSAGDPVRYRFADPSTVSRFGLDEWTGEIRLGHALDYESVPEHVFYVVAYDSGTPTSLSSTALVRIEVTNVNDNAPSIEVTPMPASDELREAIKTSRQTMGQEDDEGVLYAFENEPARAQLATVLVRDADAGDRVRCDLVGASADTFTLEPSSFGAVSGASLFELRARTPLDREGPEGGELSLAIRCSDTGQPLLTSIASLRVSVLDRNDNGPQFTLREYRFNAREETEPSSLAAIGRVSARDRDSEANARTLYQLQANAASQSGSSGAETLPIRVDAATGDLFLTERLDREFRDRYEFQVLAIDQLNKSLNDTAKVVVVVEDVNDNEPVFTETRYSFTVLESARSGVRIGVVQAADRDREANGQLLYELRPVSAHDASGAAASSFGNSAYEQIVQQTPFTLRQLTGELYLNGRLDRESVPEYVFDVLVSDNGRPSARTGSARLVVSVADANDNAPVFTYPNASNSLLQVLVSTPLDATLATVHAADADLGANGSVNYSIVSGNVGGLFQLHPTTGRLSLARSLKHDANLFHLPSVYTLTFEARDRGTPPMWSTQALTIRLVPDIEVPPLDIRGYENFDASFGGGGVNGGSGRGVSGTSSGSGILWNFGLDRHTFLVLLITAVTVVCVLLFAAAVLVLRHVDALRAMGSNGAGGASPPRGNERKRRHRTTTRQESFNNNSESAPMNFGPQRGHRLDGDARRLTDVERSPEHKQEQDLRVQVFQAPVGVNAQHSVQPSSASSGMLSPTCWPIGAVCGPLQSQSSAGSSGSGGCVGLPLPLANELSELKVISSTSASASISGPQVVLRHHQSEDRDQQQQLVNQHMQQVVSRSSSLSGARPITYLKSETFLSDGGQQLLAKSPPRESRAFSPHFQLAHSSPSQQLAMQQLFSVEGETARSLIARPLSPGSALNRSRPLSTFQKFEDPTTDARSQFGTLTVGASGDQMTESFCAYCATPSISTPLRNGTGKGNVQGAGNGGTTSGSGTMKRAPHGPASAAASGHAEGTPSPKRCWVLVAGGQTASIV